MRLGQVRSPGTGAARSDRPRGRDPRVVRLEVPTQLRRLSVASSAWDPGGLEAEVQLGDSGRLGEVAVGELLGPKPPGQPTRKRRAKVSATTSCQRAAKLHTRQPAAANAQVREWAERCTIRTTP